MFEHSIFVIPAQAVMTNLSISPAVKNPAYLASPISVRIALVSSNSCFQNFAVSVLLR